MTRLATDVPARPIELRRGSGAAGQEASWPTASTERDDPSLQKIPPGGT